jgi:lipopolysaccharide/colanic/teichoic acid biosynthesis glycosyltransferase
MLTRQQQFMKRSLDLAITIPALLIVLVPLVVLVILSTIDTRAWGIFTQRRIGQYGKPFSMMKIRTMRHGPPTLPAATTVGRDERITRLGGLIRRLKLDELPQFIHVVLGEMSLVGPRPDIPGLADALEGDDRCILSLRPGITGPATLKYRDEEWLLAKAKNPVSYMLDQLFPDKVRINVEYAKHYKLRDDFRWLLHTLVKLDLPDLGPVPVEDISCHKDREFSEPRTAGPFLVQPQE